MPLYEYECINCGKRHESIQRFSDPPLTTCPSCRGELKKLLSSPAVHFKGTGWYVTDYARKGHSSESGATSGNGKGESKSEPQKSSGDGKGADKKSSDSQSDSART